MITIDDIAELRRQGDHEKARQLLEEYHEDAKLQRRERSKIRKMNSNTIWQGKLIIAGRCVTCTKKHDDDRVQCFDCRMRDKINKEKRLKG